MQAPPPPLDQPVDPRRWPPAPPRLPAIAPGQAHLWCAALDDGAWEGTETVLAAEERARAARFHLPRDADRYRRAHAMRRFVLGRYLGCPPADLRFAEDEHGRPRLAPPSDAGPELEFNASQSGGLALLAVTCGARSGVDIELAQPLPDLQDVARHLFHGAEWRAIAASADDAARQDAFLRCWTRKEALVKAIGVGLDTVLARFDAGTRPAHAPFRPAFDPDFPGPTDWWLTDLSAPPVYAALALAHAPAQVSAWSWHPPQGPGG